MDNLRFTIIWIDSNLVKLKIDACAQYVSVFQHCYVSADDLTVFSKRIIDYIDNPINECYLEFGKKNGNYTPAFSMMILPMNKNGHVTIEVDLEIDDNISRNHRCSFFINSELGCVERFGKRLNDFIFKGVGAEIVMNPDV